jgi:predicted NUDIX family phosphoesterase
MILVFEKQQLPGWALFQGFRSATDVQNPSELIYSDSLIWKPRDEAETDNRFKQLIPYVFFSSPQEPGKILTYRRDGGGETRLDQNRSIGFGGHIEKEDIGNGRAPYDSGLFREISEELTEEVALSATFFLEGFINDDSNEVGKVHIGVVHRAETPLLVSDANEISLKDFQYLNVSEMLSRINEFETWSQILIRSFSENGKLFSNYR